jgi:O-antigen ligase
LLYWLVPREARKGGGALVRAFVAGTVVSLAIDILAAGARILWGYLTIEGTVVWGSISAELFSSALSLFLHPSYAAMYTILALAWLQWKDQAHWTLHLLLITAVVLLASKVGWIALVALLLVTFFRTGTRYLLPMVVALLVVGAYTAASPFMREKLDQARLVFVATEPAPDATGSSEVRLLVWRAARHVAADHWPMGTGTGDVKNELVEEYERSGYVQPYTLRLNAHSQFLQSAVALGIGGLILLGAMLLLPFLQGIIDRRWPAVLFYALMAVQCAVESILEVQAGVLFFALLALALEWDRRTISSGWNLGWRSSQANERRP